MAFVLNKQAIIILKPWQEIIFRHYFVIGAVDYR